MDAAPYTPLSARRVGPAKGPDSKDRFVGKLSFTPHVSQHRHSNSAHKRSPDSSQAEPSTSSRYLAHPPQSSLYIADPQTLNAVTASAGPPASQQSAAPLTAGRERLSRHKTARLTPDGRGGASGLRWRPMTPSIDSPEKQELGRRIFGGLPTSSPLSTKKGPVSNSPLQDLRASTPVAGAAQLDKLAESSHDSTTTTAADSLSHTEHQPLLVQLQQQTVQAAVVGAGPAKELEESISNHAADQASDSRLRLRNGSTALAPTPAPNAVQPWHTTNRQQQPGALPQHKVSQGTQGEKTPILAMLERLRVLQQEGTHLAGLLKL
ncbi:hypothetical protein WJX79_002322 [Trebouxia sp. C0005]